MTTLMPCVLPHTSAFSRRENARALPTVTLEKIKGAGNAGRAMRPQPRMQNKKHTSIVTTVTPERPGIPRAMVLTVSFVISPVIGLFCHRRQRNYFRQLDASVGASGPHDFAVRITRCSSAARSASTASRSAFVTIAIRPFEERDGGVYKSDLGQARTVLFSAKALDWRNQATDLICPSGSRRALFASSLACGDRNRRGAHLASV